MLHLLLTLGADFTVEAACMMLAIKSRPKYGSLVDTYFDIGMIIADAPIEMRT